MACITGEAVGESDGRLSTLGSCFMTALVMATGLLCAHLALAQFALLLGEETTRRLAPFALGG